MAKSTPLNFRNMLIYQVYTRNHTKEGTFKALENDLDRIKKLGTDVIYLLPIHPIGKKDKKGSLGCPYSISDYRKINPEYGTLEDFKDLINLVHKKNMKLMIDVVYNHTSRDSKLLNDHPSWFYHKENGECANRVGDWSDVTDFNFSNKEISDELMNELSDTLAYWVSVGVDGFRCDVAPLVPQEFWELARKKVSQVNPNCMWLAESIDPGFVKYIRSLGYDAMSDSETFQVFDICYDYDIFEHYKKYLVGKSSLKTYITAINQQEAIYPKNYVKLRCLENHDQTRIANLVPNSTQLINWTVFSFMLKGTAFIYAGQEALETKLPSLFDVDKVSWENLSKKITNEKTETLSELISKLTKLKKDELMATGNFYIQEGEVEDTAILFYTEKSELKTEGKTRFCVFNFGLRSGIMNINLDFFKVKDGVYKNLLNNKDIKITDGKIALEQEPVIFDFV